MLKKILNLKGAQQLNRKEQKGISGGGRPGSGGGGCCNPALSCCTTTDLVNNPECGATYIPGCYFHPANPNTPSYPYYNCCI
ncbi:hypothetical protein SAMN04487910_2179 [Aquimarina amphilecti]|uniref:Uncharacterized protein n=1 Tax=Aquimarina amphilecti TaxID=1038014 RepID=A0A1H7PFM0_AQUAM|nr:hypothetical protein [Aquimarina amphilecti]SEL33847.1 hypothetical protein SAMN04487910_2179 [Aquimarina amphilecti]